MRFSWLVLFIVLASGNPIRAQDVACVHIEDVSASCCKCSSWFASYEAVIVQPHFQSNIAYRDTVGIDRSYAFGWDLGYSTRIELGHASDNETIRVRYWLYDQDASFNREQLAGERLVIGVVGAVANPYIVTDGAILGTHSIQLDVLDFEISDSFDLVRGCLELGAGLRYARLTQDATWYETEGPEELYVHHESDNLGATVFGEYVRQTVLPSLELVAGARGGILFGKRSFSVLDEVDYGEVIQPHNALLPFAEIDVGLNFSPCLSDYFDVTVSAGYESQLWMNAGTASAERTEPSDQQNLGFTGLVFKLALSY